MEGTYAGVERRRSIDYSRIQTFTFHTDSLIGRVLGFKHSPPSPRVSFRKGVRQHAGPRNPGLKHNGGENCPCQQGKDGRRWLQPPYRDAGTGSRRSPAVSTAGPFGIRIRKAGLHRWLKPTGHCLWRTKTPLSPTVAEATAFRLLPCG